METGTLGDERGVRFEAIYAEAKEALAHAANTIRDLAERSREAYADAAAQWHRTEAELRGLPGENGDDAEVRAGLNRSADMQAAEIARKKSELARLDAVAKQLESSWLFLERGGGGRREESAEPSLRPGGHLQIVEAQEAERSRLAQEIHDGPAQAMANAVFQIEYIDKLVGRDAVTARAELRAMGSAMRRELEEIRAFIHQLQNPLIGALGLNGALQDVAESVARSAGLQLELDLRAPEDILDEAQQTVVLRVVQEALRNVRRHADARRVSVATRLDPAEGPNREASFVTEVRDDGRGFDLEATMMRSGRRNFGLRFMRERAELIGAQLTVDSHPGHGTTARLTIDGVERS
ncbi:MAG TPA: histidine kinase [Candidatus Limnocylindrales bacterium]|jgi:two-component system sensor histidine kinase DegS|nr:histidine kinase [Candidatus Limnocylindrales bacterium]